MYLIHLEPVNKVTRMIMHYFEWRSTGTILGIVKKYILLHQEEFYVEILQMGPLCLSEQNMVFSVFEWLGKWLHIKVLAMPTLEVVNSESKLEGSFVMLF